MKIASVSTGHWTVAACLGSRSIVVE